MLVVCSLNLIEKKVKLSHIYSIKWLLLLVLMTKLVNIVNYEVYFSSNRSNYFFFFVLILGFLVISFNNSTFVTKYCTIVDGIFRVHKSRLSEQTDHKFNLNHCTLSFPEERTRDIQFALIDQQNETIFIRGNNIYSMGRLLNTLAKYVEIKGTSQSLFKSTPLNKSQPSHVYSDVDLSSSVKSLPLNITKNIYRSASQLHDDKMVALATRQYDRNTTPIQQETIISNQIYDQPKSYDNLTSIDRNNNRISIPPRPRERTKNENM